MQPCACQESEVPNGILLKPKQNWERASAAVTRQIPALWFVQKKLEAMIGEEKEKATPRSISQRPKPASAGRLQEEALGLHP